MRLLVASPPRQRDESGKMPAGAIERKERRDFEWKQSDVERHVQRLKAFCEDDLDERDERNLSLAVLSALLVRHSMSSVYLAPPVDIVVNSGLLGLLVERCLELVEDGLSGVGDKKQKLVATLLHESCWILTNVASGTTEQCAKAVEAGVIRLVNTIFEKASGSAKRVLAKLTSSKDLSVAEKFGVLVHEESKARTRLTPRYLPCGKPNDVDDDGYGRAPAAIWRALGLAAPTPSSPRDDVSKLDTSDVGMEVDEEMAIDDDGEGGEGGGEGGKSKVVEEVPASAGAGGGEGSSSFSSAAASPATASAALLSSMSDFIPHGVYFSQRRPTGSAASDEEEEEAAREAKIYAALGSEKELTDKELDDVMALVLQKSISTFALCDQAMFAFANVNGDSPKSRKACVLAGIPSSVAEMMDTLFSILREVSELCKAQKVVRLLSQDCGSGLLANTAWACSNLARPLRRGPGGDDVDLAPLRPLLPVMATIMSCRFADAVLDATWFFNYCVEAEQSDFVRRGDAVAASLVRVVETPLIPLPQSLSTGLLPTAYGDGGKANADEVTLARIRGYSALEQTIVAAPAGMNSKTLAYLARPHVAMSSVIHSGLFDDMRRRVGYAITQMYARHSKEAAWFEPKHLPTLFVAEDEATDAEPLPPPPSLTVLSFAVAQLNYYASSFRHSERDGKEEGGDDGDSQPDEPFIDFTKLPAGMAVDDKQREEEDWTESGGHQKLAQVAVRLLGTLTSGDSEATRLFITSGACDATCRAALSFGLGPRTKGLAIETFFGISNTVADEHCAAAAVFASPYFRRLLACALCPKLVPFLRSQPGSLIHSSWGFEFRRFRLTKEISFALLNALNQTRLEEEEDEEDEDEDGDKDGRGAGGEEGEKAKEAEASDEDAASALLPKIDAGDEGGVGAAAAAAVGKAKKRSVITLPLASPDLVKHWCDQDVASLFENHLYQPRCRPFLYTLAGIFRKDEMIPGAEGEEKVQALALDVLSRPWAHWVCSPPSPSAPVAVVCRFKTVSGDATSVAVSFLTGSCSGEKEKEEASLKLLNVFELPEERKEKDAAAVAALPYVDVDEMWAGDAVTAANLPAAPAIDWRKLHEENEEAAERHRSKEKEGRAAGEKIAAEEAGRVMGGGMLAALDGAAEARRKEKEDEEKEAAEAAAAREAEEEEDDDGIPAEPTRVVPKKDADDDEQRVLEGYTKPRSLVPLLGLAQLQQCRKEWAVIPPRELAGVDPVAGGNTKGLLLVSEELANCSIGPTTAFTPLFYAATSGIVGALVRRAKIFPLSDGLKKVAAAATALLKRPEVLNTARAGLSPAGPAHLYGIEAYGGPKHIKPLLSGAGGAGDDDEDEYEDDEDDEDEDDEGIEGDDGKETDEA